jgi:hypothetical protein
MNKFYLVVLEDDGVDIKDIIHSSKKIKVFIEEHERKKQATIRKAKGNS